MHIAKVLPAAKSAFFIMISPLSDCLLRAEFSAGQRAFAPY
ncbi:MAG: hypothetical protein ACT6R2_12435 [Blastomonas fulva]|nr:hypothetical protein [Blastomonas sp.]